MDSVSFEPSPTGSRGVSIVTFTVGELSSPFSGCIPGRLREDLKTKLHRVKGDTVTVFLPTPTSSSLPCSPPVLPDSCLSLQK